MSTTQLTFRQRVLRELCGGLWHTTHPDRFTRILKSGSILSEPDIPNSERWGALADRDHCSYVRFLGGVSLFDFDRFDPESYRERCPSSSWEYFVPYHSIWERAVWIELDREKIASQTISGADLLTKWKAENAYGHRIMPEIEAAHIGPLSRTAFKRAFLVQKTDENIHHLEL